MYNYLTNLNNNYIFIIFIILFLKNIYFNNIYFLLIWILVFLKINFKLIDLIALHNTLFIYHPISLYITVIILLFVVKREKKYLNLIYILCWFSFILGGYWASQEFNWGGWWNWDALEMGILFTLIYLLIKIHVNWNFFLCKYTNTLIILFFSSYWIFNKLGLTISIHSFVKNTFFLKYMHILYLCFFVTYLAFLSIWTIILLLQLKLVWINIYTFKLIFLFLFFYYLNDKKIKIKYIKNLHKFIFLLIYVFGFINYNNITFYKLTQFTTIFYTYSFNLYKIITHWQTMSFLNILKKEFFFFKFINTHIINYGWIFNLSNNFSTSSWILTVIMLKKYTKYYTKLHKKRIFNKSIITFNYINNINILKKKKIIFLYFYKTFFVKFKFFRKLRKLLKKKLKKKYLQIFFFCKPNFLIHEKFKNARMGKGKGSPTIWVFQPNITNPTFIFKNFSIKRAILLKRYIQRYFNPYILMKLI